MKKAKLLVLLILSLHAVLVMATAVEVFRVYEGPGYQEELQLWYVVGVIDLPVSILWGWFDALTNQWIYTHTSPITSGVIYPTCVFLIGGTIQWLAVVLSIRFLIHKLVAKKTIQSVAGAYGERTSGSIDAQQ